MRASRTEPRPRQPFGLLPDLGLGARRPRLSDGLCTNQEVNGLSRPCGRSLRPKPTYKVVNRDRSGDYTDAVRRAAPDAIQVADRFHHLKNLGDVVLRVFRRRL